MHKNETEHIVVACNQLNSNEYVLLRVFRSHVAEEIKFRFVVNEPFQSIATEKHPKECAFMIIQSLSRGVRSFIKFYVSECGWKFVRGKMLHLSQVEQVQRERIECSGEIIHGEKILNEIYESI